MKATVWPLDRKGKMVWRLAARMWMRWSKSPKEMEKPVDESMKAGSEGTGEGSKEIA